MEYRLRILSLVADLLQKKKSDEPIVTPLGPHSTMSCFVSCDVEKLLIDNVGPDLSIDEAQAEYTCVRNEPSHADYKDRMYMGLRPSHRLAFLEFRRFGITLPFGAVNSHFNTPNSSLFSDGMWLPSDYADPLKCWE
jgi:hypothetical protein